MEQLAERMPAQQSRELNQELRISTDTTTWLAETLHGSMRTEFEFSFDGQELRGEDGGSLDDIFDDAIIEARAITEWNPSMLFELRRRLEEREELNDMYKMVSGELPNTMIVISDFPEELASSDEDVGGYNVNRQQTMMRIITLGDDGKLRIVSQSLDGSNREALEAIYGSLGETAQDGELLSQRIHRELPAAWQKQPDRNILNTYDFVVRQTDLIEWFTKEKLADPIGAEKLRYKLAATAKDRHDKYLRGFSKAQESSDPNSLQGHSYNSFVSVAAIANSMSLQHELEISGRRAASRGEVFSGCGASVKPGEFFDEVSSAGQASTLGYGNRKRPRADDDCEFTSKKCPACSKSAVRTKVEKIKILGTSRTKTKISGSCGCSKTSGG